MNAFEIGILDFIKSNFSCRFLDAVMPVITYLGSAKLIIPFLAVLLIFKKTRKFGITLAATMILGLLVGNAFLKNIVCRERPFVVNDAVQLIMKPPGDSSFPSGHAAATFEMATILFLKNKKWGAVAYFGAVVVSFSRLYLYFHYPTDVLCGVAIGILSALTVNYLFDKYVFNKKTRYL